MNGTAYFIDGHSEPIYRYEITDKGLEQCVEFSTPNGTYKLDYDYITIHKDIHIAKHKWFEYVDRQWVHIPNIIECIELSTVDK